MCTAPYQRHISKVFKAVEYIKRIDEKSFQRICRYLPHIFIVPGKGHFNSYFINEKIWFIASGGIEEDHPIYLASLLVHESQHMVQARQGQKYVGTAAEKDAYTAQRKFLQKISSKTLRRWFTDWLDTQLAKKWWIMGRRAKKSQDVFRKALSGYKTRRLRIKMVA